MYAVGVSDHIMIAHSLRGAVFGPAQGLHGATYEVRIEIETAALDADGIVLDIGRLRSALGQTLGALNYRNLDELPAFAQTNSTTEVLCAHIHGRLVAVP